MKNHILNQWRKIERTTKDYGLKGESNIAEIYKENYRDMVHRTFRNEKGESDTKEMYARITSLAETKQITDFITPGESFIISND